MEFINLAKNRYSLRKFSEKPVEKEKLDLILKAGLLAPTACNNQPQRILVIENEKALGKIRKCTPYHFNAPIVLLICYNSLESWKRSFDGKDSGDIDASIVTTHLILQASELGLGTTWVGHFNPDIIKKEFSLPNNIVPVALLPLGYPTIDASPNPLHYERNAIEKIVFYNNF